MWKGFGRASGFYRWHSTRLSAFMANQHNKLSPQEQKEALQRLLALVEKEAQALIADERNFKITINASSGQTFKVEVVKYLEA